MAKQQPIPDNPTADEMRSALSRIQALEAELQAAKDREAHTDRAHQAELEQARSGFKITSQLTPVDGNLHKFKVALQYAPTAVVAAVDAANAYETYKRTTGVRSTQYEPEIAQVADDTPLTYPNAPLHAVSAA